MVAEADRYPARLEIDYPEQLDRLTTALRIFWIIPIAIVYGALSASGTTGYEDANGDWVATGSTSIASGLAVATALMIIFRQRYPRWWFDFALEFGRFGSRIGAYAALLTDQYPSTEDQQSVHYDLDYPDAKEDLNRWLPLVKWLLLLPHYIVLVVLAILAFFAVVIAWFAILFTGRYPRGLFDFVVGVGRWALRVGAYGFLLITDRYPPFRLEP